MASPSQNEVEKILATFGVTRLPEEAAGEFALGRTITPSTFARQSGAPALDATLQPSIPQTSSPVASAADAGDPLQNTLAAVSIGPETLAPMPRIALSGSGPSAPGAESGKAPADFEILGLLGEGGMGRVHLARQRSLGRDVAIKSLKEDYADSRVAAMLRAEATVMGRLEHPNVVPVHAVGFDEDGRLVLVMKRIDGVAWSELLKHKDHPRWKDILESAASPLEFHLDVLTAVARALHFAHENGVIHRDVKPDNVLVGSHGDVYLADWGVALRLGTGRTETELVGTPAYMAKEMVVGDPQKIDARTDVYLLGATLHEVLTGKPPREGKNLQQILIAAYEAEPPSFGPEVPSELAAIARTALAADASARYPSALAFQRAIDDVRRNRGSIALARSGLALLAELASTDAEDPSIDRKLTEARFAFVQALRDWPENRQASLGLEACLRRAIDHEIRRENATGARALLSELKTPEPALAERIAALDAKLRARLAESERLKKLEAEQDLAVGHRARLVAVAGLLVLTGLIAVVVLLITDGDSSAITGTDIIVASSVILAMVGISTVVFRRRLLANAAGRRVAGLAVLSSATILVHRILGVAWGLPPAGIMVTDLALFFGTAAAAGLVSSRLLWALPVPLIGAALALAMPSQVSALFSVTGMVMLLVLTLLLMTSYQVPKQGGPPPTESNGRT